MIRKIFAGLFAALFICLSFNASAQTPEEFEYQPLYCGTIGTDLGTWGASKLAQFSDPMSAGSKWEVPPYLQLTGGMIYCTGVVSIYFGGYPNGSRSYSDAAVCDYINGWTIDTTNLNCKRPKVKKCLPGQTLVRSFIVGYSLTAGTDSTSPTAIPPINYCDGKCMHSIDAPENCVGDTSPSANGQYAQRCNIRYTSTGAECSTQTPDPAAPPAPAGPGPSTGSGGDGGTSGGSSGGSTGGTSGTGSGTGTGSGDTSGNGGSVNVPGTTVTCGLSGQPACPTDNGSGSGSGSGTTGSGTGTGGAGAGGGGTSAGNGEYPAPCGAPGQPVCAVKIDEGGTTSTLPAKEADVTAFIEAEKQKAQEQRDKASGGSDKGFLDSWSAHFWSPPSGPSCQPFQLPSINGVSGLSYDPCEVVEGIRRVASLMWYGTALFMCLGMVRRVF